ncbi:hypothetical protein Cni_G20608 [Canna indica]|uniref:DNA-(apurinic or apyrimidinic site) lyase n=1 Tax=Canna indica TaxID=4628 RepID=A0AAQ3KNG9_9LILI|nr:hypothetical protein Cni_G20608 [Canna indica]
MGSPIIIDDNGFTPSHLKGGRKEKNKSVTYLVAAGFLRRLSNGRLAQLTTRLCVTSTSSTSYSVGSATLVSALEIRPSTEVENGLDDANMPMMPDDNQKCVESLQTAMEHLDILLPRPNATCDTVLCFCGMVEVNVMGTFHLIKAALPSMKWRTKATGLLASIAIMSSQVGQVHTLQQHILVRGRRRWTTAASNADWRWAENLTVPLVSGSKAGKFTMRAPRPLFSFLSSPEIFPTTLAGDMAKRWRLKPPMQPPSTPPSPSLVLSPPSKRKADFTDPLLKPQRSLAAPLATADGEWELLQLPRSELSLPLTLPTGQTFRWRRTASSHYTGVVGSYLVSLQHLDDEPSGHVAFLLHNPDSGAAQASARVALADYLNLGVSLAKLWDHFSAADSRFAELAGKFEGGARVLRQEPLECVFQFLCSSNNNIARIEKMVSVLSSFGEYLGTVGGFDFHEFPSLERLSLVTEQQLREAGFGYRAKYIVATVTALQAKPGGGAVWLASLRELDLEEVIDALCTLPGVGPKVAACIALFSLDQHHAIPVDTHVWQAQSLLQSSIDLSLMLLWPNLGTMLAGHRMYSSLVNYLPRRLHLNCVLAIPLSQNQPMVENTGQKEAVAKISSDRHSIIRVEDIAGLVTQIGWNSYDIFKKMLLHRRASMDHNYVFLVATSEFSVNSSKKFHSNPNSSKCCWNRRF